jgi:hypothetical protein
METKIPAATWMVRSFTPQQKDETFTEVDPRKSRIAGYHKYQDEKRPGARLDQPTALGIARNAFPNFGVDYSQLDLKEALAFQQPNRRDWLFHFQERAPLAGEAFRRVSVRAIRSRSSHRRSRFRSGLPRRQQNDADQHRVDGVCIIGGLALLSLTAAGLSSRRASISRGGVRRSSPRSAIAADSRRVLSLPSFGYDTRCWDTFVNGLFITTITTGVQIGLLFRLAAIEAAYPQALDHSNTKPRQVRLLGVDCSRHGVGVLRSENSARASRRHLHRWHRRWARHPAHGRHGGRRSLTSVRRSLARSKAAVVALFVVSLREMPR